MSKGASIEIIPLNFDIDTENGVKVTDSRSRDREHQTLQFGKWRSYNLENGVEVTDSRSRDR